MWLTRRAREAIFSGWIERHHAALYRHALWMCGHAGNAEDAVQETYFQAWLAMKGLKDENAALPWLLTIQRRILYREYQQQSRFDDLLVQLQTLEDGSGAEPLHAEWLDLCQAMAALTTSQRDTLLLHALHGYSYQEISAQLNIPIGTVMSRISRAKALMRQQREVDNDKIIELSARLRKQHHE